MTQILTLPDKASGRGGPRASAEPPDPTRATLSEVWSVRATAAPVAFVLSALARPGPVLWVQDRLSGAEAGRPQGAALRRVWGRDVIHVRAGRAQDLLMAMEMGLGCPALAAVLGEVWGAVPRLDFTATKRLALRAEASGVPCWLVRHAAEPGLSAARERWRLASLPSAPDPWDARAPGAPRWRAELFRSRGHRPGTWVARHERVGAAHRLDLAPLDGDGAVVAHAGSRRAAR